MSPWSRWVWAIVLSLAVNAGLARGGTFTPGNLVVVRINDGTSRSANEASPVFLDEFTTSGSFVQTVALPTAPSGSNRQITLSNTSFTNGQLALSTDGQFLTLGGYDAAVGTASITGTASATTNRVLARVD